jgi:hypothetical protein
MRAVATGLNPGGHVLALSRRRLILAAASLPALAVAGRGISLLGDAVAGAARAARPAGDGTSATRCAQCGASDHSMLDPRCPLAPKVLG